MWTADQVPDLHGRTAVVTGANSGLGYQTALVLASRGASVVMACRNPVKAAAAVASLRAVVPDADVSVEEVDLASLGSVRRAAERLRSRSIDLLINNAGAARAQRVVTEDGFESTFAGNHLGAFALTGLLLDRLVAVPGSRVVTVSSIGHRRGVIDFGDLQGERNYRMAVAYSQSKLANLMFTYELQRRLGVAGVKTVAVAAHPGNAYTNFGRELNPVARFLVEGRAKFLTWWLLQSQEMGALGILRAAVDPRVSGGEYFGPPGRLQFRGYPEVVESSARSHDVEAQQRLWAESSRLSGVVYPV